MIEARFRLAYGDAFQLDVDLALPASGVTVLFGASGSGKTSLLRCIAGLQSADAGKLIVNGQCWQDSESAVFLPPHQRPIGYVFQQANLFPHLTVADNIQFGCKRLPPPQQPADLAALIELLGIGALLQRRPAHLSGGEQQRVAIARALALNPQLLLLDEPLAALDFKRKQELLPYLQRLQQRLQIPMIYITHSLTEMAQLADHLVVMEHGKVQAVGDLLSILSRVDLPMAQQRDASVVWQVEIAEHDVDDQLTRVRFAGGELWLPLIAASPGTPLRVQIYARDVSVSLERAQSSSILNILPAVIDDIQVAGAGQTLVRLKVASYQLLAHITQKSSRLLQLKAGASVYVQIKGTSVVS